MALGPHCKAIGVDEEVLNGQKSLTCDIKSVTNGILWELKKYKTSKRLTMKDVVDWFIKIFEVKCENTETIQEKLNEKIESFLNLRNTFMKAPNKYRGELERLMNWPFEFPAEMGIPPPAIFEPVVSANLGPKLLKVLKEKGGDDDDSIDMSGPSDDDDEQIKKKKAREEIIQLKKDLGAVKKVITSLNDRMVDLNKQCLLLNDFSKTSVSERRRIETDIKKLKNEWRSAMSTWHDCMERLNHVNNNKGNYLDVGYMVRRNKTKQGIFDELNLEFEKTLEEFKHKVTTLIEKERRKKKVVAREYRQKSKTDRKRVRQESDENEESKKQCLSEEATKPVPPLSPAVTNINVDEFMKSEKIDEFKGGKFINALKAIFLELTSMPLTCNNVHEILFSVMDELEPLNTDKIPTQSFAGNIFMEARMAVALQAFLDNLNMRNISICNDGTIKFSLVNNDYDVTLGDETHIKLGVRDISKGSPDTTLDSLKDLYQDLGNNYFDSNTEMKDLMRGIRIVYNSRHFLDKKLIELLFSYKQNLLPLISAAFPTKLPDNFKSKVALMNNFYTGLYFLYGLAKLADVTVLAWESVSLGGTNFDVSNNGITHIFSKTIQEIFTFCEKVDPGNQDDISLEFKDFMEKERKLKDVPLAPHKGNIFNVIFHNTAGIWFYHEIGLLNEFSEKVEKKGGITNSLSELLNEKHSFALARALGLLGKLVAVPLWTVLEDDKVEIGLRYTTLLKSFEKWAKDSSKFMKGQELLFEDVLVSHDAVYVSLIKDNEASDAFTKEVLELIFTAFLHYTKYFLYGASNFEKMNGESEMDVDEDTKVMKLFHEDFKLFDRITMGMHFATQFASEALTFYNNTRNGEFKDKLFGKDNAKISGNYELVQDLVGKDSSRQLKDLYKRKIKLTEIEQASPYNSNEYSKGQLEKKYKLIDDLIKWGGLWKSEKEIDAQIKDMSESDRLSAFKAQIRFRRHVLGVEHGQGLLDLASEGECFNADKLKENLKIILKKECEMTETDSLELASSSTDSDKLRVTYTSCKQAEELKPAIEYGLSAVPKENFHWLLGKLVHHTVASEQAKENLTGVCIARKKLNGAYSYFIRYKGKGVFNIPESRIAGDYKNNLLKVVDPSSNDLIGSVLSRAFIKDDGDLEWHDCKVVGVDKNGCDFVIEFDLHGVDDHAAEELKLPEIETLTFTSRLLDDYRNHHLRLL